MPFLKLLKKTCFIALVGSVGLLGYEVHETYNLLNNALDVSILDHCEPKKNFCQRCKKNYVYIESASQKSQLLIDRFWDSITFSYARRLLSIAQSDDRNVRLRAVNSLAKIKNLDNWHYSLLAHMCDARTAVGLARTSDVDLNFFLNPPSRYIYYNHEKIVSWMKHFLISLQQCSDHPCMAYFISKAFVNVQEVGRMVEHDISSVELKQCIKSADDILPLCIQSILHHSTIEPHARDIVQQNGLPLLMELFKRYKDNTDITISIVKIIANISVYPELLQDIYRSGWIGVLSKMLKHDDIRINGPAARALANLDSDDHLDAKFERKIYLLHPVYRSMEKQEVDVILVHGLLGGVFFTWRQRDRVQNPPGFIGKKHTNETITCDSCSETTLDTSDPYTREFISELEERNKLEWNEIGKDFEIVFSDCPLEMKEDGPYSRSGEELCSINNKYTQCWPKDWLPQDCSNLRIIGINYDTTLSFWAPMCPLDKMKGTLDERSDDFLDKLINAGIGKKPIVWLTHSMGGLLVKNILVKASESSDEKIRSLFESTRGIVFYSTPHKGTRVASLNQTASMFLWPSIEVRELKEGSPALEKLHNNFLNIVENSKIQVLSFVETQCTTITPLKLNFNFVPKQSAVLKYGEYYELPLDHLGICKPLNRLSFLYQKVLLFIEEIVQNSKI